MAVDMFLKIDGIAGESKDHKHKDSIQIESFSFGVQQHGTQGHGGGLGAGKAHFQDISVSKRADKASPVLMLNCANGKHIKNATITVRKAGENPQDYYKIVMTDVMVTNFQNTGHGGDDPHEQVGLHFSKVEFHYAEQKEDGTLGNKSRGGYDLKMNKSF